MLYRETSDGIENVYVLKILNKAESEQAFSLSAESLLPITLLQDNEIIVVDPGQVEAVVIRARLPKSKIPSGGFEFSFKLSSISDTSNWVAEQARFVGPTG